MRALAMPICAGPIVRVFMSSLKGRGCERTKHFSFATA
jgi:hypothetical protein